MSVSAPGAIARLSALAGGALIAGVLGLVVFGGGCATASQSSKHGESAAETPAAGPPGASEIRDFADLRRTIIPSGGRQWMILPTYVVAVNGTFVQYRFGEPDGILGSILSVDSDDQTLYLGTSHGVNLIDTQALTIDGFVSQNDSTDIYMRWLHADSRREIWGVSRQAVAWIDVGSRTWRSYPFQRFEYADLRQVLFDGPYIWFATSAGLRRFSRDWKAWDPTPGGRELGSVEIYKLSRDADNYLWAITVKGLYRYNPSFDNWDYVGR